MLRTLLVSLLFVGLPLGAQGTLEVVFLDVGQGDSTLIISPGGQTLLFDAGDNGQGSASVFPYLSSRNIDTLDYLIASHYHADHIGGVDELVDNGIEILTAYDRGGSFTTQTYMDYADAVSGIRNTMTVGQQIDLGSGVTVTCLTVNGMVIGGAEVPVAGTPQEENSRSISLLVEYGDFELFVGGDLSGGGFGTANIESVVSTEVGDVEVLRINHHCSETSSNGAFLGRLKPEVAVISVGPNSFGFPHSEPLSRLETLPSLQTIYQTQVGNGTTSPLSEIADGDISLTTDGFTFTVEGGDLVPTEYETNEVVFDLVINEIMKNPTEVGDATGEYFEIYNRGSESHDLHGWVIRDDDNDSHVINAPGGLVIDAGEYLVFAVNGSPGQNGGVVADYVYTNFILANGDDEVVLGPIFSGGVFFEASRVAYDDASFPDTAGRSMELTDPFADVRDGASWADATTTYGDGDFGTPGGLNSTAVPVEEPFVRGDTNGDTLVTLPDALATLAYLFQGAEKPTCLDAHDVNDSGTVAIDDVLYSLFFQFAGGGAPPAPFPSAGPDPTPDPLSCLP